MSMLVILRDGVARYRQDRRGEMLSEIVVSDTLGYR